jgi:hypothetical protein
MSLIHVLTTAQHLRLAGDIVATGIIAASWADMLTPLSTIIAFVYLCVRLYETKTAQRALKWLLGRTIE